MKPTKNRVLVKTIASEDRSEGGIYLPENSKADYERASVVAVGPGHINHMTGQTIPVGVVVGDTVLIHRGVGVEINHKNEKHLLLEEDYVLAML